MRILAKILKGFAIVWSTLVAFGVVVGIVGIIFIGAPSFYEGWLKFTEIFSPFNWRNYLLIILLLSPASGAYALHERLKKRVAGVP